MRAHVPAQDRTQVRTEPDAERPARLAEDERTALKLLVEGLDANWSLAGPTSPVYGVPKPRAGLPLDAPASPEPKTARRELFALLHELLVGRDTSPRLPTLLPAPDADRIRSPPATGQPGRAARGPEDRARCLPGGRDDRRPVRARPGDPGARGRSAGSPERLFPRMFAGDRGRRLPVSATERTRRQR
ncbi:hypothetical protein K353_04365 [Kitasatospora sp. SolWspMP-SS2h]|nr:hypothetical protein K353_04365 [Kitasatospora sp. SolWspMP-SS2h]